MMVLLLTLKNHRVIFYVVGVVEKLSPHDLLLQFRNSRVEEIFVLPEVLFLSFLLKCFSFFLSALGLCAACGLSLVVAGAFHCGAWAFLDRL